MNKLTTYQCDVCGGAYCDEESCKACEQYHKGPVMIERIFFKPKAEFECPYPEHILFRMADGALVKYVGSEIYVPDNQDGNSNKDEVQEQ